MTALPPLLLWMCAAIAFGALVALAAYGADRALRAFGRETRHAWAIALVVAAAWPVVAASVLTRPAAVPTGGSVIMGAPVAIGPAQPASPSVDWGSLAQTAALTMWVAGSLTMLALLAFATHRLRRMQRQASERMLDGERVLVSDTLGPAAIGVTNARVVVPTWILELDPRLRAFVLRHEREHCRAHDPALLWGASLVTALMPWNPALWYTVRRLRLAMEMDCDTRTLAGSTDADTRRRYAQTLLLIAQRNGHTRFAPTLVHTPSQLARRVAAMNATPARHPHARAAVAGAVALLALTAACSTRVANGLAGPATTPESAAKSSVSTDAGAVPTPPAAPNAPPAPAAPDAPEKIYFDFQVQKPVVMAPGSVGPKYPDALRAARTTGSVLAQFVVRPDGLVDGSTILVLKTSHQQFSESVVDALTKMRFLPATKDGRTVSQLVQQPFMFALSGAPAADSARSPLTEARLRAKYDSVFETKIMEERLKKTRTQSDSFATSFPVSKEMEASIGAELARMRRERPTQVPSNATLFDFQTEQPAKPVDGTKGPEYPAELRAARTEGSVLIQVVIDENGQPMMGSFKVLKSDHVQFSEAVKAALAATQFTPAKVGGKGVRQLVQLPFQFSLGR